MRFKQQIEGSVRRIQMKMNAFANRPPSLFKNLATHIDSYTVILINCEKTFNGADGISKFKMRVVEECGFLAIMMNNIT